MTYQEIQDYADMLVEARIGTADIAEVKSDFYQAKPSTAEYAAINKLADAYYLSEMWHDVDWDSVEIDIFNILNIKEA